MELELVEYRIETVQIHYDQSGEQAEKTEQVADASTINEEVKYSLKHGNPFKDGMESGQDKNLYRDEADDGTKQRLGRDTQNDLESDEIGDVSDESENGMGLSKQANSVAKDKGGEGGKDTPTTLVRCVCTNVYIDKH